jgi:hypothetical protein
MNGVPVELDWVQKRAACSLEKVFKELAVEIEDDVRAINQFPRWPHEEPIESGLNRDGSILFVRRGQSVRPVVKLILGQTRIEIIDEVSNQTLSVTLTLNDEGRCKLRIGTEELEKWQVRRRALEALFFGRAE